MKRKIKDESSNVTITYEEDDSGLPILPGNIPVPLYRNTQSWKPGSTLGACYQVNSKEDAFSSLIKASLMLKPRSFQNDNQQPYPMYEEKNGILSIPRVYGLLQFGAPEKDLRIEQSIPTIPSFCGELKPFQREVVNHVEKCLRREPYNCAMITAECGLGKTCMSIHLVATLKMKTAILVHKEFLMTQWIERFEQFLPGIEVGRVQGSICDIKDVTIIMIQTCLTGRHNELFNESGISFVIVDECHHICAKTFNLSMRSFAAKYLLGLSATPERSDGNEKGIFWLLGAPSVFAKREKNENVSLANTLKVLKLYGPRVRQPDLKTSKGQLQYSRMITRLVENKNRTNLIVDLVHQLYDQGREILIISERVSLLDSIASIFESRNIKAAKYVGENTKKGKRKRSEASMGCKIILTTRAMASEGFDRPSIDTVVLATPFGANSTLEQSIGRCQRMCSEKKFESQVVDVIDNYSIFYSMARARQHFYASKRYNVVTLKPVEDNLA